MSVRGRGRMRVAVFLPLCLFITIAGRAQSSSSLPCESIFFKTSLNAHDDFERELGGGLLFRLKSMKEPGWFIDVVPAEEAKNDYIYPVNPPLRLNPIQTLGSGYGETVESSLAHPHVMNFLLHRSDYEKISSLIDNVLWPYKTADPEKAVSDYTQAVDETQKGQLKVVVASHKTDRKTGMLEHIKLRVEITVPAGFQFAPGFFPLPSRCLE
jgi:hypothetical protein